MLLENERVAPVLICVDYEDNELLIEIVLRAAGDLCRGVFGGIAEEYADSIYRNIPGISAHVLAEKIFRSTGETELDDTEVDTILSSIDLFPGVFADSMKDYIGKHKQIPQCRKG